MIKIYNYGEVPNSEIFARENALFLKVQHHCTSLSAGASDAVLSSGS